MNRQLFVGPIIHSDPQGRLDVLQRAAILVENGKIINISENPKPGDINADYVRVLSAGQFLIPGFVDGHIHAAQFPNLGIGYNKCLLEWLETYTFPIEKKYADSAFAEHVYKAVVKRTLTMGTTTACYFASLHTESSLILAKQAVKYGQRCLVGKVNMNHSRKDGYCESTKESIAGTTKMIKEIAELNSSLIMPVITPRFALSCDMELMTELGKLAKEMKVHVQTHISENLDEIEAVTTAYKEYPSYAAVYDAAGLLTNKTVLAHGIHLGDSELALLKSRGSAVIHCPSSNTCLRSGLCDVQRLKDRGLKIGLGTDISGGDSSCMLNVMRAALQVSYHLSILTPGYTPLNYKDVFHLATLGGATALAMQDEIGSFVPGKQFDALVIDLNGSNGPLDNLIEYTLENRLERLIHSGDDRNIVEVYVAGHRVK
ncbi:guanine deaminase [Neodiprion pinetum]|uniref:guanine deaminase n=1 Tax=Neodiprion pinetum TaxID=441929 RepID=UPI001EDF9DEA|nr:guanine deaminase [Neodiprion pinetum]XP_046481453.1 guanine deaminase [Neodiprion pinetum]XP_046481455.1 guanine deaminase [Neodiprion pinetum]